jgi:hypothetical protein
MKGFLVMSEPDFKPDYSYWWNKKNLTKGELVTLALGINPEAHSRANEPDKLNETVQYFNKFYDYIERETTYSDKFESIRRRILEKYWLDKPMDKHAIVNILYDLGSLLFSGLYMHPDFLAYLASVNEKPTHFDSYYNHEQYLCDFETVLSKKDMSENESIGLLMGFEATNLIRFTETAYKKWEDKTPEERFFNAQYTDFLKKSGVEYGCYQTLIDTVNDIKIKKLWSGDFQVFLNTVYDKGYIFSDRILEKFSYTPEYSKEGWAYKFYQRWLKNAVWTFDEAKLLFKGECPDGRRNFIDFSQQKTYVHDLILDPSINEYVDFKDRFTRAIAAQNIISRGKNAEGQDLFIPKEIVQWLLDNTQHRPPKQLLDVLDISEISEKKVLTHSGLAGRPTAKHLYLQEMSARASRGELLDKVAHEARYLRDWFKSKYPDFNCSKDRAIENSIRDEYKKLKSA